MAIFRGTGGQGDSTTDTTVTTVTQKAAEAASSATSAANSATSASNSATSAETSATNAATSESNAATSATNASTSATAAETAKTAAQAAQTAAETAETNAETAEANAVTAKNQAESARDNAIVAQTAAETAETNAETAYSNTLAIFGDAQDVQDAVDSATASATTATTKASEAATSATNAANSATSAGTSETNAASSASSAATSAASASSYATDAQTAQTAAETAQAAAEAAEYNINGLYLGSLADDPTLDGNGVAVTTGDLYFNTTAQEVRVYTDGDVWEPVVDLGGDVTVNSLTSNNDVVVKGNLEVQGTTITVDSATAQTIDLGDNDRIRLGDSDDLQVYHDGTDSYIANSTGTLKLSGNTDVTGNITVSGTVDGRDIAADGATLDTALQNVSEDTTPQLGGDLDTNGNDIKFGDNDKATFGAGDDLEIYHSGTNTFIREVGTGSLRIQGADLELSNPSEIKWLKGFNNDRVELFYNNSIKLATTSSGVDVTGTLVSDQLQIEGSTGPLVNLYRSDVNALFGAIQFKDTTNTNENARIGWAANELRLQGTNQVRLLTDDKARLLATAAGNILFYEDTGTTAKLTWDASAEELQFKDNVKAKFGDGGDLELYSDGTNGIIKSSATQEYRAVTHSFESTTGGSTRAVIDSTGIDVTGTVTADGATIDGTLNVTSNSLNLASASPVFTITDTDTSVNHKLTGTSGFGSLFLQVDAADSGLGGSFFLKRANTNILQTANSTGDISFYDDAGTSQDFYWDASTSRLGLGVTSPAHQLQLGGSSDDTLALFRSTTDTAQILVRDDDTLGYFGARNNFIYISPTSATGADGLVVRTDTGNVGIGTTSPDTVLHVENGASSYTWTPNARTAAIIEGNNASGTTLSIIGKSTGYSGIFFGDEAYEPDGQINYDHAVNAMRFATSGGEKARIDSSGNLLVGTTTSPSDTNTIVASAGIYLGGTGSDNLLDDYEEGTWTPVFTPATGSFTTMTMDVVTATYTKIGDTVRINCFIRTDDVDVTGASGAISISGLPFAANAYNSLAVGYALGWATNKNPVGAYTNSNTSEILITEQTAIGGATSSATVDSFATGTNANYNRIIVTGVYTTNA